jgi:hypothetical protein
MAGSLQKVTKWYFPGWMVSFDGSLRNGDLSVVFSGNGDLSVL